jgi:hypothetical protein
VTTVADTTRQQQHEQVMNKLSGFFLGIEDVPSSPTSVSGFVEPPRAPVIATSSSSKSCDNIMMQQQQQQEDSDDGFVKLQLSNRTQSMPLTRKSSMKKLSSLGNNSKSASTPLLKRSVSFASLSIREYNIVMGDNPSCSYGVPISLGWNYQQHDAVPVSVTSADIPKPRRRSKLLLSYNTRRQLLKEAGYKSTELRSCIRQVNKIKNERAVTELFLAAQPLEDAMETVVHRVSNLMPWNKNRDDVAMLETVMVQSADI